MKKVAIGFLCLLMDITVVTCLKHFGFVLPIVGILFLCFGFLELEQENDNFIKAIYYALAMASFRAFIFGLQCFDSALLKGSIGAVMGLIPCLFLCYILNHTLFCFNDISYEQSVLLPITQNLFTANLCVIANVVVTFLALFIKPLAVSFTISIISNILFFISFYILSKIFVNFSKDVEFELV